jgi:aryl-alcohol dehydrogenase-like predicted oxidoreductase
VTQMIYNILEQDPGREFILAAERGPSYGGVAEAMKGEANKRLCVPSNAFEPSFRAWKSNPGPQFLIRVTHSSGMLEGRYTIDTKFDESDHRSHRPRSWMVEGIQKVERLKPFCEARGVTMGQLALLWLYAHPSILSALPNIYDQAQLDEFAGASEHAPLTDAEMEQIHELYERDFDITPHVEEPAVAQ